MQPQLPQQAPAGQDPSVLMQLLQSDVQQRGIPYSPGGPQGMMAAIQGGQSGQLTSQSDGQLIEAMSQARGQGGQQQDIRAIRGIIEGRHTDDIARGPAQQSNPVTSADQNEQSWWQRMFSGSPYAKAGNAMQDANKRGQDALRDQRMGR